MRLISLLRVEGVRRSVMHVAGGSLLVGPIDPYREGEFRRIIADHAEAGPPPNGR